MPTTTEPEAIDAALAERWVRTIRESHPHFPREMLELALATGTLPTAEAIMRACGCDARMAEQKRRSFEVEALSPASYRELFAAEDALGAAELALHAYDEAVARVRERLADIAEAIQALTAERLRQVRPELQVQLQEEAAALDEERVMLQRQYLDLVGGKDAYGVTYIDVGEPLRQEVARCIAEVERASVALEDAKKAHLLAVDEDYLTEALETLAGNGGVPVPHIIGWARAVIDPHLKAHGFEINWEHGSERIKQRVAHRIAAA